MVRRHSPLTSTRVMRLLLESRLDTICADKVAARLNISPSTLRRRLHMEGTSYQILLDRVRRYRCEQVLARRRMPGKSLAAALGFKRANSFYRAFRNWTGVGYGEYRRRLKHSSSRRAQGLY